MFSAAKELGLFENQPWFKIIDSINVNSMFLNSTSLPQYLAESTILILGKRSRLWATKPESTSAARG